ncbi:MAG: hypothetical protein AAFP98_03710 [Pseudomonadota bacterium]
MRATLLIIPVILTACATPREACLAEVTREVRVLDGLIAETRANLSRGFAVEERQEVRTRNTFCTGRNDDGTTFRFRCEETDTVTRRVPIAIDLDAERAKLESLERRQAQNRVNADAGIAQCQAQFPAEV